MQKIFAVSMLVAAAAAGTTPSGTALAGCYKNSTTRGAGTPISSCAAPLVQSGLLCYPACKSGFKGVGPVCWEVCPPSEVDTGAFCNKRIIGGDNSGCKWDDKCGLTLDKGCVKCPAGFTAHGCLCDSGSTHAKKSYGRGAGVPLGCSGDSVISGALCYPKCPASQKGNGPVCWSACPASSPYTCGGMCLKDSTACEDKVKAVADNVLALAEDIALCVDKEASQCSIPTMEQALKTLMADFLMPIC